ncbi:hypothetical protein MN202_06300 [Rheinheimera muenzenbergensis]|uniref:Uncharacterized protein n=1 Tax=Rheinheimera muenzenbergensis TaxID=1193628 RepID=A0ABU8C4Q0_9GAMM
MKTLTLLSATTLLASAVFCSAGHAGELSAELQAATAQHVAAEKAKVAQQAHLSMLHTVIDIKARLQAEQDASQLLASQTQVVQVAE